MPGKIIVLPYSGRPLAVCQDIPIALATLTALARHWGAPEFRWTPDKRNQESPAWLAGLDISYRGGVVLAINDTQDAMPTVRKERWACTTWAALAQRVAIVLDQAVLPPIERFLAGHFAGFIHEHLMGDNAVTTERITFEDVALLRAIRHLGAGLNEKTDRLVAPLVTGLEEEEVGHGKVTHPKGSWDRIGGRLSIGISWPGLMGSSRTRSPT